MQDNETKKGLTDEKLDNVSGGGSILQWEDYNTQTCGRCGETFTYRVWIANNWNCPNCTGKDNIGDDR